MPLTENFSAFEIDEELLPNLQEYALANAIYWGLAEGHACEQSARRNAMDVSDGICALRFSNEMLIGPAERLQERRRDDQQVPDSLQPNSTSCHYRRAGRNYHWCHCFGRHVNPEWQVEELAGARCRGPDGRNLNKFPFVTTHTNGLRPARVPRSVE